MIDRRGFLALAGGLLLQPALARAQDVRKIARVGYLSPTRREQVALVLPPFFEGLRKRGFVEGQNFAMEVRAADFDLRRLSALATELADAKVDVIVAAAPPAIVAASRATKSIPIVMAYWGGPGLLDAGFVASLARPGGNVTGVHLLSDELDGKRLELLLEAVPKARRIGVLAEDKNDAPAREVQRVASAAKIDLVVSEVPGPDGYDPVFAALARRAVDGVMVPSSPKFAMEATQIIAAAAAHRTPAIYEWTSMARAGGLMSYGASSDDLQDRAADYVARILHGGRPAGMPVEQPARFELAINTKTAKTLGLTIPPSLMLRADPV